MTKNLKEVKPEQKAITLHYDIFLIPKSSLVTPYSKNSWYKISPKSCPPDFTFCKKFESTEFVLKLFRKPKKVV